MPGVRYFREIVNGVLVVAAPAEIGTTAAEQLRAVLLDETCLGALDDRVESPAPCAVIHPAFIPCSGRTSGPWPKVASCAWSVPLEGPSPEL